MKFFKCLTLHCYVFAGYNYEACAGRFKNFSVEKSELNFCICSVTLLFCAIFFIRKKLFEGSLRVDLPLLLWFVFVLVDSLALNFIFIYIPYRCKSKAYSASYIKVYFAINNWIRCRGKKKLIIIGSKRKQKLHSQIPRLNLGSLCIWKWSIRPAWKESKEKSWGINSTWNRLY